MMSDHPHLHHHHLDPLVHVDQDDDPDAATEARARAGRAIRDIGHALVGHHAATALVEQVATTHDSLATQLSAGSVRSRAVTRPSGDWSSQIADGEVMTSFDERPISGRSSPWGLDLTVVRSGDEAVAHVTLRAAHEGAPGRSHGGVVTALFDDVFGFVLAIIEQPAFTGEISVRFAAGVPIGRPLECRARLDERVGRKLLMRGELRDGDHVVATSSATFIAIDPSAFGSGAAT
jgi:acyl-coenzyme A thioesterase PaaI-like protein